MTPEPESSRGTRLAFALALLLGTLALYSSVGGHEFVVYDDRTLPVDLLPLIEVLRDRAIEERIERIEKQIAARTRALPLFRDVLEAGDLASELRAQRDHPAHKLLRRMFHENRSARS